MSISNYEKHTLAFRGWRDGAGGKPQDPTYSEDSRKEVQTIYCEAHTEGRKARGQYAVDSAKKYGVDLSPLRAQEPEEPSDKLTFKQAIGLDPVKPATIEHAGDCSIYKVDCDICDCGALRQFVGCSKNTPDSIWIQWAKHQAAIARSTQK